MMTAYFGSCRKATNALTRRQKIDIWRTKGREPIPGGMPVELKAGDGIVYIHMMLHWGSNYSAKVTADGAPWLSLFRRSCLSLGQPLLLASRFHEAYAYKDARTV